MGEKGKGVDGEAGLGMCYLKLKQITHWAMKRCLELFGGGNLMVGKVFEAQGSSGVLDG